MMRRQIAIGATLVVAILGAPRLTEAGLLDIIWEMSGPQMLGVSFGCLVAPGAKTKAEKFDHCRLGEVPVVAVQRVSTNPDASTAANTDRPRTFIGFSGGIYGSTSQDSSTQKYKWWEIGMVELGAGLSFRSFNPPDNHVRVNHGFGVIYERLFGRGIDDLEDGKPFNNGAIHPFNKFAFSVTPIDVTINDKVAVGIKLRLYPDGFTDDEFKAGLPPAEHRPFESTVSFTFSYIIKRK